MFSDNRIEIRQVFAGSWKKFNEGGILEPLERLIVEIIKLHPEYHGMLNDPASALDKDYLPEQGETNPFLHMGMHISIQEQIKTDRPRGIAPLYHQLVMKIGDAHETEHRLMECLGQMLWEAQRAGRMPDEKAYLACAAKLLY